MSSIYARVVEVSNLHKPSLNEDGLDATAAKSLIEACVKRAKDRELTSDDLNHLIASFVRITKK